VIPLARMARGAVVLACATIGLTGVLAAAVRVLPWLIDPSVPWSVAEPFARGLAAVACESALLAGWPIGWSVACFRLVESGEARVLQSLGERPWRTVARLKVQGAVFAALLASVAGVYGRDASAPGRVATELIGKARASCQASPAHVTYAVPFTDFTWLCVPGRPALLVGSVPAMSSVVVSARDARLAGDFRAVELDDARVSASAAPPTALHVGTLVIRGMAPWAQASSISPPVRAVVLALSGLAAAALTAHRILLRPPRTRMGVLAFGAVGPLAALGWMRLLERAGASPWTFAVVPIAAGGCPLVLAWLVLLWRRLREESRAATTKTRVKER